MNFHDYFYLSDRFAFVGGASHALLVDLESGNLQRPNGAARKIIELSEQGLTIAEALDALKSEFDNSDVLAFIDALSTEGLMTLSSHPKPSRHYGSLPSKPDFLWMEITAQCNLRCIHCYAEAEPENKKELPFHILTRVLDQAAALGWRKVQFTGGECTLRDDLPELIMHARAQGFEFIEVFTNGTILTEPMIGLFSRQGVHVALSLYSYREEIHDSITRVCGSFERTMRNLEYLLAYKVPVRCTTVAMKENEQDLVATTYFTHKLGVLTSPPDTIRPTGRGRNMDHWPENYGRLKMRTKPRFSLSREQYEQNRCWNSCWHGKVTVTSSGDVIPCIFARDQVAGNIATQTLEEIINGETMRRFWSLTYDMVEGCKDCEYRYFCRDCRPWVFGSTGNLYGKSPRCGYDPYLGDWPQVGDGQDVAELCDNQPTVDWS